MTDLRDIKKVREACKVAPLVADALVGRKILLRLCNDVERYRVENEDLQRYGQELEKMLEKEIESV